MDSEKFIHLIQGHPCLWDVRSKTYKNSVARDAAWRSVSEGMGDAYGKNIFEGGKSSFAPML